MSVLKTSDYVILLVIACCYTIPQESNGCIYPTGLTTDPGVPTDGVLLPLFIAADPYFDLFLGKEPAIQFRQVMLEEIGLYGGLVAFEPNAIDMFARVDVSENRRRCQDMNSTLFDLHRRVTLAYTLFYSLITTRPGYLEDGISVLEGWGLDAGICNNASDCLDDITTPWGLAFTVVEEAKDFMSTDGWNADGLLSREYNTIPFQDFRGDPYVPQNDPWRLKKKKNWQPLLESDDLGFLFYQEHVVPHIGYTGKSFFFGDDYLCSKKSRNPRYNYNKEMELTLSRAANLTDELKMEIEVFDVKFDSLFRLQTQYFGKLGLVNLDDWDLISNDVIFIVLAYEVTLLVWKEKIYWDAVRPPSIIHDKLSGQYVTSYAGTTLDGESFGTQTFFGDDWEPYIRTMPHAEYPSASACVCEAFAAAMIEITGVDDFTDVINGSLEFNFAAFSSEYEPLSTPASDISVTYNSWTEISDRCGESRLNGGMHFTGAVQAGKDLCREMGTILVQRFDKLFNGEVPDYVVDFNDRDIPNRQC